MVGWCFRTSPVVMDFGIPLATGQSVLIFHSGADGIETKEILEYADQFRSCIGPTGAVCIAGLSELGTGYVICHSCICQ